MRRLFPCCLLLGLATATQADPVTKSVPPANSATHNRTVHITVPPVPSPVNAPPEYLLTSPVLPGSGPAWRAAQEEALREAAFRYLFAHVSYASRLPVYYLSVGGFPWELGANASRDPTPAFLAKFHGSQPPVQAVSVLPASSKDWKNAATHHWIIFRVSSVSWTGDASVQVACGLVRSDFISSESLYLKCISRNGRWQITETTQVSADFRQL